MKELLITNIFLCQFLKYQHIIIDKSSEKCAIKNKIIKSRKNIS